MTTQADVRRILAWRDRAARTFGTGPVTGIAAAPAPSENALPAMAMHALQLERQPMEVEGAAATRGVRASDVEAYEELNVEL